MEKKDARRLAQPPPDVAAAEPAHYTEMDRRKPLGTVTETPATRPHGGRDVPSPPDPFDTPTAAFVVGALRADRVEARAELAAAEARLTAQIQEARAETAAVETRLTEQIRAVRDEARQDRAQFRKDQVAARAEFQEGQATARAEFRKDQVATRAEFQEGLAAARGEFQEGQATARGEFQEGQAAVRVEIREDVARLEGRIDRLSEQNAEILARLERLTAIVEGREKRRRRRVARWIKAVFLLLGSALTLLSQYVLRRWPG